MRGLRLLPIRVGRSGRMIIDSHPRGFQTSLQTYTGNEKMRKVLSNKVQWEEENKDRF